LTDVTQDNRLFTNDVKALGLALLSMALALVLKCDSETDDPPKLKGYKSERIKILALNTNAVVTFGIKLK